MRRKEKKNKQGQTNNVKQTTRQSNMYMSVHTYHVHCCVILMYMYIHIHVPSYISCFKLVTFVHVHAEACSFCMHMHTCTCILLFYIAPVPVHIPLFYIFMFSTCNFVQKHVKMCCSAFLSCTHCMKTSHTPILPYSHTPMHTLQEDLPYSHTPILSYSHAHTAGRPLILSYSHTLILSCTHCRKTSHTLILPYSHTLMHTLQEGLSYSHTPILSYSHAHTAGRPLILSYSHTLILPCTLCRKTSPCYAPWPHSLRDSPPTSHCGSATTPRPPSVPTIVLCENSCPPPWPTCAVTCTLWQAWCPGCMAGTRVATWSWSWRTSRTTEGQSTIECKYILATHKISLTHRPSSLGWASWRYTCTYTLCLECRVLWV